MSTIYLLRASVTNGWSYNECGPLIYQTIKICTFITILHVN